VNEHRKIETEKLKEQLESSCSSTDHPLVLASRKIKNQRTSAGKFGKKNGGTTVASTRASS
jgi:hypothetical protein